MHKYSIYDVTDDEIIADGLTFTQAKERIAVNWAENEMQYNKIMRSPSMEKLNRYGSGLGYYVEVKKRKLKEYVLYSKGQYVCEGTIREIAEFTGKSIKSLRNIASPSYGKRFPDDDKRLWMMEIEEDEENV